MGHWLTCRSIAGVLIVLHVGCVCPAIEVWVTTGSRSELLAARPEIAFRPGTGSGGIGIQVSAAQTYQSLAGFGASMTDSSAWLIDARMSPSQRNDLLRTLFSTSDGIGMSFLRLPMGASDFTASGFYTYNDLPAGQTDATQSQFSIAHDEAYIIPLLQQARSLNPDVKLMATPWSAPAWMKTNQSLFGGELQFQWYGSYAHYFKKFIDAYAAHGLPIDAVTLQNEPLHTSNYPTMRMTAGQQADMITNYLGPLFASSNIDTKILLYDHNWDNTQYADMILNDPVARSFVAGTAFHGYAGDVTAQSVLHSAHPDKDIYFTEISGGDFAPNFDDNLVFGIQNIIIRNTRNWGRTALYWNLALDENDGPHLNGCSNCRGVVTVDSGTGAVTFNEEFYTIAHASKFLRPGAVRIDSSTVDQQLETVAFQNPDGSKVLIALNPSNSVRSFRIIESGQHFAYQLPAKSVATYVWGDVAADFDDDGVLDGTDVDRLVAAIVAGNNSLLFDLNRDGTLDGLDLEQWLIQAGSRNLDSGNPYPLGDANLDGTVDGADFGLWNSHKFHPTSAWTRGDFNADGVTDGSDFSLWNRHKFTSSGQPLVVPEPHTMCGLGAVWMTFCAALAHRSLRRRNAPNATVKPHVSSSNPQFRRWQFAAQHPRSVMTAARVEQGRHSG